MRRYLMGCSILVLASCGGAAGGVDGAFGESGGGVSSSASLALTGGTMDAAPVDLRDATAVNVTVLGVELLVASGSGAHVVPVTMDPATVNLLVLRHDANALLGKAPIDGKITQIRMDIDGTAEVVLADGTRRLARVPSGDRTGIKIITNGLDPSTVGTLTLEFDPAKSIHETGNGELILRPTIKLGDVGDGTTTEGGSNGGGADGGGSSGGGTSQGNSGSHTAHRDGNGTSGGTIGGSIPVALP